jgi:hypothetical protein
MGYWEVHPNNFGYTQTQVANWVSSALNSDLGWKRAGPIGFQQVPIGRVVFQVVETIPGGAWIWGVAHIDEFPVLVELEAGQFGNMDLVNHEAGHAFFMAGHSPEGSASVMEPFEEGGDEWPSQTDIAQVRAWLGNPPPPQQPPPPPPPRPPADLTYWFPSDLKHYITKWPIPEGARTRVSATIIDGSPCVLRPIWAKDHLEMLSGEYSQFGRGPDLERSGFFRTSWQEVPGGATGDTYVGLIIDGATSEDFDRLVISHAEVHIVGAALTGGGSPIPN